MTTSTALFLLTFLGADAVPASPAQSIISAPKKTPLQPLDILSKAPVTLNDASSKELFAKLDDDLWVINPAIDANPLHPICPRRHLAAAILVERHRKIGIEKERSAIENGIQLRYWMSTSVRRRLGAAVALAELGDSSVSRTFSAALLDDRLAPGARIAAVYALAEHPKELDEENLRRLLGKWLVGELPDNFDIQKELSDKDSAEYRFERDRELVAGVLWALVQSASQRKDFDPTKDKDLLRAYSFGKAPTPRDSSLRRIVAIAFATREWKTVPALLQRALVDKDDRVRQAAVAAIAEHPTDAGRQAVTASTRDSDARVRTLAITMLGRFPGPETAERLSQLLGSESPVDRQAALVAAAQLRFDSLIFRGASDPVGEVRIRAAEMLAGARSEWTNETFRKLLTDTWPRVQLAAVQSAAKRPKAEAVPLLLDACGSINRSTRIAAVQALATLWPPAARFPVEQLPHVVEVQLRTLRERWTKEQQHSAPTVADKAVDAAPAPVGSNERIAELLTEWHRSKADRRPELAKELLDMGPPAIPKMEAFLKSKNSYPGPDLVRSVFARLDPVYARLAELTGADANTRGVVAARLVEELSGNRLTEMQAVVLVEYARKVDDELAWIRLMPLLERDQPSVGAGLSGMGMRHANPRLRQMAAEFMGRNPQLETGGMISDLFEDENPLVRQTALKSAGMMGDNSMTPKLMAAMCSPNSKTRLAAASSLHRLGQREGTSELRRLSSDMDPDIRRAVLLELGESADINSDETRRGLLRALEDEKLEVRRAAVQGLERFTKKSFAANPDGLPVDFSEQVAKWKKYLLQPLTDLPTAN